MAKQNKAVNSDMSAGAPKHQPDARGDGMMAKMPGPTREQILQGSVGNLNTQNKRGIVYLTRVPPHLKPARLRQMLEQHGKIDRIYLAPDATRSGKVKGKGKANKTQKAGKSYSEGWIEFEDKRIAKRVVRMLNGQNMGTKRRSKYFYDLWNLKYLSGFKWEHLTEDIAYRKRVRDQKLAAEVSAAKKERDFYLSKVDQAQLITEIEKRKQEGNEEMKKSILEKRPNRSFTQVEARLDPVSDRGAPKISKAVLALIGGKK